jgi:hypothetical protein
VEEVKESTNYKLEDIATLLTRLPDLEKGLVRIHYGRVSAPSMCCTDVVFSPRVTLDSASVISRRIEIRSL